MAKSIEPPDCQLQPPSKDCLSTEQIQSLLLDLVSPQESAIVEDHLSTCEYCRTQLEAEFGVPEWWSAAKESLSESPLNESLHDVGSPHHTDWHQLLGPTDDPSKLGRIGNYEVVGMVGRGGMGVVFKAFDSALNRYVAIKMLAPHLATSGAARKRFAREAQAAAAVVDDNVLPIYGVDQWQGVPYFVMQYSRGLTLQKRIQEQGALELKEILRIGLQTSKGLAAAHAQGLVHRDVKPSNILLDGSVERVLLSDFGLARAVDDASLTRTGTITGTPQYMSPEQIQGGTIDARCDLFSLGCVLYAISTGRAPFRAESSYAILRQITDEEPRPIRQLNPEIPEWFEAIVTKLMAKSPADRFDSAAAVAELLEPCLAHVQQPLHSPLPVQVKSLLASNKPKSMSRLARIGVAVAAAVIISFGAYYALFGAAVPSVEGKWHDEVWGEITLTPSTPGEYDGTFSGLDGKAKGIIRLRWSRKEGRFNGTWSDGESQSGRISLRPANDEIRGALTTVPGEGSSPADPQDKTWDLTPPKSAPGNEPNIKSGPNNNWFTNRRPRLGDFVWTKNKTDATTTHHAHHERDQQRTNDKVSPLHPLGKGAFVAPPQAQMALAFPTVNWRQVYIGRAMEPRLAKWHQISDEQQQRMQEISNAFLREATPATRHMEEKRAQSAIQALLTIEQDQLLRNEIWLAINATRLRAPATQDQLGLESKQRQEIDGIWSKFAAEVQQNNGWLADGTDSHQQVFGEIVAVLTLKQRELYLSKLQDPVFESGYRPTLLPVASPHQLQDSDFTGQWRCIRAEKRGVSVSPKEISSNALTLSIGETTFTLKNELNEAAIACEYTLATVTSDSTYPHHIDLESRDPIGAHQSIQGIIQLRDGLLYFAHGKGRPSSFKTSTDPELDQRAYVFERIHSSTASTHQGPALGAPLLVPDSWFRADPYPQLGLFIENPVGNVRMELELAAFEPAQRELELTPEQRKEISELRVASLPFDPEGAISETTAQAREKMFALLKLSQRARLNQLIWQRFGYRAFETPAMQTRLELSDGQKQELHQAWVDHTQRVLLLDAELAELRHSGDVDPIKLAQATADKRLRGIASYKKAWDAAYSILTPQQRERFNTLRGPLVTVAQKPSKFGADQSNLEASPVIPPQSRESLQQQLDQEKAKFPLYDAIVAGEKALGEKLMVAERALFDDREAIRAAYPTGVNDFQQWQRDYRAMIRSMEIIPSLTKQSEHRALMLWVADRMVKGQIPGTQNPAFAKLRDALPEKPSETQLLQFLCDVFRIDLTHYEGALERSKIAPPKEYMTHCREAEALRALEDIQTMYIDAAHGSTQIQSLKKKLEEAEVPPVEKDEKPVTIEDLQEEEARQRAMERERRDPTAVLNKELQGTWVLDAWISSDGVISRVAKSGPSIHFENKSGWLKMGIDDEPNKFTFVLDAQKSPAEIDLKYAEGVYSLGLIELKNGTLSLRLADVGNDRPASMTSKEAADQNRGGSLSARVFQYRRLEK